MIDQRFKKILWMVISFTVFFSIVRLLQHYTFNNHALDDGFYDNLLWNTSQGRLFYSNIKEFCSLGDHLHYILLFFVPFYFLHLGPGILYIGQTALIAIGAIPIYWLAKERLNNHLFILLFPLVYLLYVPIVNLTFQGFYQIALAITPLLFAFYYLLNDRYRPFLLWLLAALICQEDVALIAAFFGIYILLKKAKKGLGLGLFIFGIVLFIADLQYIIPFFKGSPYTYYERYAYLGNSFADKLTTLFFHPSIILQQVLTLEKIIYVVGLFLPVAFLSFFSPTALIPAIPVFAQNLLSTYPEMYKWGTRYPSSLIPFIFISAILGLEHLLKHPKISVKFEKFLPVIYKTMWFFMILSLLYFFLGFFFRYTFITPSTLEGHQIISMVPKNAAISALGPLYPHLSQRKDIWLFPKNWEKSDYIILCKLDPTWPIGGDYAPVLNKLKKEYHYGKLLEFTFLGEIPKAGMEQKKYQQWHNKIIKDLRFKTIKDGQYYILLKRIRY